MAAFKNAAPLSQVIFVHDYIQLVFGDIGLSLYSSLTVGSARRFLRRSDAGFGDSLVSLIGQRVTSVDLSNGEYLRLYFSGGDCVDVSLKSENANGPEHFQLNVPGMDPMVEQVT